MEAKAVKPVDEDYSSFMILLVLSVPPIGVDRPPLPCSTLVELSYLTSLSTKGITANSDVPLPGISVLLSEPAAQI
jgi:hypothetical protein